MWESSELTRIRGIGAARALWLADRFGIRTPAQLAAADPGEIERQLGEQSSISRTKIDSWMTEAAGLAATEPVGDWQPVASYVVEFQRRGDHAGGAAERTSVHHVEQDHTEVWSGVDGDRLAAWMTGRLTAPAEADDPAAEVAGPVDDPAAEVAGPVDDPAAEVAGPVDEPAAEVAGPVDEPAARSAVTPLRATVDRGEFAAPGGMLAREQPWAVRFEWSAEPQEALLDGEWLLDVMLSPLGTGRPVRPRSGPARVRPDGAGPHDERVPIAAGTVPPEYLDAPLRGTAMLRFQPGGSSRALLTTSADLGYLRFGP